MKGRFRWSQHPESSVLVQLQALILGMWYTVPGTTTHSTNDKQKEAIIKKLEEASRKEQKETYA